MKIIKNYSLKKNNTFGVEAKAGYFVSVTSAGQLRELIQSPLYKENEALVLGGGSNVLFTRDYEGIVVHIGIKGMSMIKVTDDYVIMEAGAGENWHNFVKICVRNKYFGLENLALIPGSVGAAPVQNIGAYGVEQKDFFHSLAGFDLRTEEMTGMNPSGCRFAYRNSIFKNELKNKFVITGVCYKLSKHENLNLSYKELDKEIKKFVVVQPTAQYVFDTVCRLRRKKLPDPELLGNAGSFFKNPEISPEEFENLKKEYPDIQGFGAEDKVKISAGRLIEKCGWKGRRVGDAGVFERNALILVNHGNAGGKDILDLAERITEEVRQKFGIKLEKEVNMI